MSRPTQSEINQVTGRLQGVIEGIKMLDCNGRALVNTKGTVQMVQDAIALIGRLAKETAS